MRVGFGVFFWNCRLAVVGHALPSPIAGGGAYLDLLRDAYEPPVLLEVAPGGKRLSVLCPGGAAVARPVKWP